MVDVDNDGVLELIIAHGESGEQTLTAFRAEGAREHHYLRVKPKTQFGAPARGENNLPSNIIS